MAFLTMNVRRGATHAGLRLVVGVALLARRRVLARFAHACDLGATRSAALGLLIASAFRLLLFSARVAKEPGSGSRDGRAQSRQRSNLRGWGLVGAKRWLIAAASCLLGAPSLRKMCDTWTLAVLTLITSSPAISRLV